MLLKGIVRGDFNQPAKDTGILLLRIAAMAFMLTHGLPKLSRLLAGGEIQFGDPIGIGPVASLILSVFAEAFCSVLIGLGLFSRLSAIPLIINMAVAGFIVHAQDPFGGKEMALLYLSIYISLFFLGGGKYSVDHLLQRNYKGNNNWEDIP